eukprot:7017344-Pyramimonas_sp.AAC.1
MTRRLSATCVSPSGSSIGHKGDHKSNKWFDQRLSGSPTLRARAKSVRGIFGVKHVSYACYRKIYDGILKKPVSNAHAWKPLVDRLKPTFVGLQMWACVGQHYTGFFKMPS